MNDRMQNELRGRIVAITAWESGNDAVDHLFDDAPSVAAVKCLDSRIRENSETMVVVSEVSPPLRPMFSPSKYASQYCTSVLKVPARTRGV